MQIVRAYENRMGLPESYKTTQIIQLEYTNAIAESNNDGLTTGAALRDVAVGFAPVAARVIYPVMYGVLLILPPSPDGATVTALRAPVASGTEFFPVPISRILLSVTLNSVFARLISSLSKS